MATVVTPISERVKARRAIRKAGKKALAEAQREHLAADERRPEPIDSRWKCTDCGEEISIAEHVGGGLCQRCDPEFAGRGNWHEVPEIEPPAKAVLGTSTPAGIREHDPDVTAPTLDSEGLKKLPEQWGIIIDPDFRDLLDPLEPIELEKLRSDIIVRGCIDPLIVWRSGNLRILLDGHHRYQLSWEHRKPVAIKELEFASRAEAFAWMRDHQVGRRNVTPEKKRELLAKDYAAELDRRKNGQKDKGQKNGKAAAVVAEKHGVSPATVKRAVSATRAKQLISEKANIPMGRLIPLAKDEAIALAQLEPEEIKQAFANGRNAVRTAARKAATSKKEIKRAKRPKHEIDLRHEAQRHIERYLDTIEPAEAAWQQSDFLLDALNQWRSRRKGARTVKSAKAKRKPR